MKTMKHSGRVLNSGSDTNSYVTASYAVFWLIITLLLVISSIRVYTSASVKADPYTSNCSWYTSLFNRGFDCIYRDFELKPTGADAQLTYTLPWLDNNIENPESHPLRYDTDQAIKRWRLWNPSGKNYVDGVSVDRQFVSQDGKKLGIIDKNLNRVFINEQKGWQQLKSSQINSVKGITITRLMPQDVSVTTKNISISPSGIYYITESERDAPRLWSFSPGTAAIHLEEFEGSDIEHVVFSDTEQQFATLSNSNRIQVWDTKTGEQLFSIFRLTDEKPKVLSFSRDDSLLLVLRPSGMEAIDILTGKTVGEWNSSSANYSKLAISPGVTNKVVVYGIGGEYLVLSLTRTDEGVAITPEFEPKKDTNATVSFAAFSADSSHLILVSDKVSIRRSVDGHTIYEHQPDGKITDSEVSDDHRIAWIGTLNGELYGYGFEESGLVVARPNYSSDAVIEIESNGQLVVVRDGSNISFQTFRNEADRYVFEQTFNKNIEAELRALFRQDKALRSIPGTLVQELVLTPSGSGLVMETTNNNILYWRVESENPQISIPKVLDMDAGILYGEFNSYRFDVPNAPVVRSPFRANETASDAEPNYKQEALVDITVDGETDRRIGVGSNGGLYVSWPEENNSSVPPLHVPLTPTVGDFQWYRVETADSVKYPESLSWSALSRAGNTIVAVGMNGAIAVSHNLGSNWKIGRYQPQDPESAIDSTSAQTDFFDVHVEARSSRHELMLVGRLPGSKEGSLILFQAMLDQNGSADQVIASLNPLKLEAAAPLAGHLAALAAVFTFLVFVYFYNRAVAERQSQTFPIGAAVSDRPIGWTDRDVLGLQQLAIQISRFIRNIQTEAPLVLGLSGSWGSGKSSCMNLLYRHLQKFNTTTVWFNAWHHEQENHLLASLFENIRLHGIPSIFSVRGIIFRSRLVLPRIRNHIKRIFPWLVSLGAIAFVTAQLMTTNQLSSIHTIVLAFDKWGQSPSAAKNLLHFTIYQGFGVPIAILLIALVWLKALWKALPTPPARLLQNIASFSRLSSYENRLNFRSEFEKDFSELCEALKLPGSPGLVIFIDDLDRCKPESVLIILETVNFLTSSGDCIVVLGFDRDHVESLIGLEFKEIVDAKKNNPAPDISERLLFARRYLEKLINIEISIPELTQDAAGKMAAPAAHQLIEDSKEAKRRYFNKEHKWREMIKPKIGSWMMRSKIIIYVTLQILLLWYGILYCVGALNDVSDRYRDAIPLNISKPEWPNQEAPSQEQLILDGSKNSTASGSSISKSKAISYPDTAIMTFPDNVSPLVSRYNYEDMQSMMLFILLFGGMSFAFLLYKMDELTRVYERDSTEFTSTLEVANKIIQNIYHTPRAVKRFSNNARLAASRFTYVNYETSTIDKVAKFFRIVDKDYIEKATIKPEIEDRQVVALCVLDAFLESGKVKLEPDKHPLTQLDEFAKNLDQGSQKKRIASLLRLEIMARKLTLQMLNKYLNLLNPAGPIPEETKDEERTEPAVL